MQWVLDALATLLIGCVDAILYALAAASFDVFQIVSRLNIFGGQGRLMEIYTGFSQRIYTALSIIMVFVFAYQMLMLIINPEAGGDKKVASASTGLIKDVIISVAAIVAMPLLFRYMTIFQNHVIDDNVIFKFVLGTDGTFDNNGSPGREIAMITLLSFYHPYGTDANTFAPITQDVADSIFSDNEQDFDKNKVLNNSTVAAVVTDCVGKVKASGDLKNLGWPESLDGMAQDSCEDFAVDIVKWRKNKLGSGIALFHDESIQGNIGESVEYFWIICSAAGAALVWFFVSYAIDLGTRAVKLAFLELIAPIPLVLRIVPNARKSFDTWKNELIKTYIDVFIRVATIAFIVQLCMMVPTIIASLFDAIAGVNGSNIATSILVKIIATVALVLGLLKFAKDAPALFKAIFSTGGTMFEGLNLKPGVKKRVEENDYAMKGISAGANMVGRNRTLYRRYRQHAEEDPKLKNKSKLAKFGYGVGGMLRNSGKTIVGSVKDNMGENSAKTFKDLGNQQITGAKGGSKDAFDSMDHGFLARRRNIKNAYEQEISGGTATIGEKYKARKKAVKDERERFRQYDEDYQARLREKARFNAAAGGGGNQNFAPYINQQSEVAAANSVVKSAYKSAVDKKMEHWTSQENDIRKQLANQKKAKYIDEDGGVHTVTSWSEYKKQKAKHEYELYGSKAYGDIQRTEKDIKNGWTEISKMSQLEGMDKVIKGYLEKNGSEILGMSADDIKKTDAQELISKLSATFKEDLSSIADEKNAKEAISVRMQTINGLSSSFSDHIQSMQDYDAAINPSAGGDSK